MHIKLFYLTNNFNTRFTWSLHIVFPSKVSYRKTSLQILFLFDFLFCFCFVCLLFFVVVFVLFFFWFAVFFKIIVIWFVLILTCKLKTISIIINILDHFFFGYNLQFFQLSTLRNGNYIIKTFISSNKNAIIFLLIQAH